MGTGTINKLHRSFDTDTKGSNRCSFDFELKDGPSFVLSYFISNENSASNLRIAQCFVTWLNTSS